VQARFAYLILAHRCPGQLRALIEAIYDPKDLILLHVDLKSLLGIRPERNGTWPMARQLARVYPNMKLLRPRCTNWGGWSLTRILLDAINTALQTDDRWTHFINLSGQCYPIKPIAAIRSQLSESDGQVFVQMRPFASLPSDDWHLRWHPMIELPHKAYALAGPRRPPADFALEHKGSQWCILPRAFCVWQQQAPVGREIRRYLRRLLLSDELIIQTLVNNGPWRARIAPHYGREIVWPGPKVMTMADWPRLQRSQAFFARKFDPDVDGDIVPALARAHRLGAAA
jgi:Core-2/I-Branching enzyme